MKLKIQVLNPRVGKEIPLPYYATAGSAGMDLHACIDAPLTVDPGDSAVVPTGIAAEMPSCEYAGFVFARSGLAIRHGIALSNGVGVIDSDYTGEICVGLINQSKQPYTIRPGDRIAQLLLLPVCRPETEIIEKLSETSRGGGGFGSTGR